MKVRNAIISVHNKTGLVEFATQLRALDIELISSGGTAATLRQAGLPVTDVTTITGMPEMLDGRVKTLHPKIHAAILAQRNEKHLKELERQGIKPIDMVVVNLYPFEQTVLQPSAKFDDAIEQIDIGGVTLIRAAAKNFLNVAVLVETAQYVPIAEELRLNSGELSENTLRMLAVRAFEHTATYDAMIYNYFHSRVYPEKYPDTYIVPFRKMEILRYGENAHQRAVFCRDPIVTEISLVNVERLHGRELSYNNILDISESYQIISSFPDEPTAVVIKHGNPCGLASAARLEDAYRLAYEGDKLSAFGGIIGLNRKLTPEIASHMASVFIEAVIAPDYDTEALEILRKKKNLRVLRPRQPLFSPEQNFFPTLQELRKVPGGLLVQDRDLALPKPENLRTVTKRAPSREELELMLFGWKVVKFVKSNAIVFATYHQDAKMIVGVGAGQMSRVMAVKIAAEKAGSRAKGAVMASDAFFPFRDGIDVAGEAGITAVIQPGGSVRDKEVIEAANAYDMAMIFTGLRAFRH